MARLPRVVLPGCPLHIIQRGNNRQATFYTEADYVKYLEVLGRAVAEHSVHIHAYVLMTNHIHLLVTPEQNESLSLTMQSLGREYVRYINNQYNRSGTLWEGRFKSALIDSESYLLTCYRYIELDPVRAGMVRAPGITAGQAIRATRMVGSVRTLHHIDSIWLWVKQMSHARKDIEHCSGRLWILLPWNLFEKGPRRIRQLEIINSRKNYRPCLSAA